MSTTLHDNCPHCGKYVMLPHNNCPKENLMKAYPDLPTGEETIQVTNSLRYTQKTLADEMQRVFDEEIMALRSAGQKEYSHDDGSPFANFERTGDDTDVDPLKVLWIFAMKHKDGIASYIKGHTSQREDVRGRINDLIVYLLLARGIINERVGSNKIRALGDLSE